MERLEAEISYKCLGAMKQRSVNRVAKIEHIKSSVKDAFLE